MSIRRTDLNKCIGCENCLGICPMDVFRFDYDASKSIIAYPENCQQCGQCVINCPGDALYLAENQFGYGMPSWR